MHADDGLMGRFRALAGFVGPAAFITAWATLGARTAGYSPTRDPISLLAAADAPTRAAMTAGLVACGAGVGVYSRELGLVVPGGAGHAAVVTAAATLGIAVTPLHSAVGGVPHAMAAGLAYASLAGMPLLAAPTLARRGRTQAARASVAIGVGAGACLAWSVIAPGGVGLWQRLGLSLGHAWLMISAVSIARSRQDA